jgi:hypothetical protein
MLRSPRSAYPASKRAVQLYAQAMAPAASYVSGTDILVDGGTIAGIAEAGGMMRL